MQYLTPYLFIPIDLDIYQMYTQVNELEGS